MPWIVDTCVLLDVLLGDPAFAESSSRCLDLHTADGIAISPITYIELVPHFAGSQTNQDAFLREYSLQTHCAWSAIDTLEAHALWANYIATRRELKLPRRPVADALIAAFSQRFRGLITRNTEDFRRIAPSLPLINPTTLESNP